MQYASLPFSTTKMLGCPSPKKSFKSSDNAHHIVGGPGEVSCVVREGAESFQARVEELLGSDSYQTIFERSGECWLLIGLKKNALYYCAQSANSKDYPEMFSCLLTRQLLSRHTCPVR